MKAVKNWQVVCAGIVLGLVFMVGSTHAKDLKGRAGLGVEQTLGGASGITLRYWPAQAFGFSLTAGAKIVSYDGVDETGVSEVKYASVVTGSVGLMYNLARSLHANLGAGVRFTFGFQTGETNDIVPQAKDGVQINVEIPLQMEFFLSDSLSLSVATGVVFAMVPEDGPALDVEGHDRILRNDSVIIDLGAGGVAASMGIVYYF